MSRSSLGGTGGSAVSSTGGSPNAVLVLERLRHASLLADKRDMLAEVKRLLSTSRKDIANRGLDILIKLLKQQPRDNEIIQLLLDIFFDLLTSSPPSASSSSSSSSSIAVHPSTLSSSSSGNGTDTSSSQSLSIRASSKSEADITATALLNDVQNISTILDFVTNNLQWLRLSSLKVLTALCRRTVHDFATCLVKTTIGMGRLVDCLDDNRNEIRDELLILLCMVTENNKDVGTFFAFQDGYEKLFRIITNELQKYDEEDNELLLQHNDSTSPHYLSRAYIPSFDSLLLISNALEIIRNITQTITTQRLLTSGTYCKTFIPILDILFATFPPSLTDTVPKSKTNTNDTTNGKTKNVNNQNNPSNVYPSTDIITNSASLVLDCSQLVFEILTSLVGGYELVQLTQNPSHFASLLTLSPLETVMVTLEKLKEENNRTSLQRDIGAIPGLLDILCGISYGSAVGITLDDTLRTHAITLLASVCIGHTRNLTQLSTILVQGSPYGSLNVPKKLHSRTSSKHKIDTGSGLTNAEKNNGSNDAPFDLALTCAVYAALYSDNLPLAFASRILIHTYLLNNEAGRISFIAHAFAPPPIALPIYMAATAVDNENSPIPHRLCVRYSGAIQRGGIVLSDVVATVVPPGKAILSAVTSAALVLGSSIGAPLGINAVVSELASLRTTGAILASALTPPHGSTDSSAQELLLRFTLDRLDMKGISMNSNSNNHNETLFGILSKLFVTAISAEPETLPNASLPPSTSTHPIYGITGTKSVASPIPLPISIQLTFSLLRILLATISHCPGAVNTFLAVPSNLAMVDIIAGNASSTASANDNSANTVPDASDSRLYTYGAGALLLASCFVNANEQSKQGSSTKTKSTNVSSTGSAASSVTAATFTKTNLLQLLQTRIGINRLTTLSQNLLDSPIIISTIANKPRLITLREAPNKEGLLLMDKPFAESLIATLGATSGAMMNVYSGGLVTSSDKTNENGKKEGDNQLVDASMLTHFKELIRTQDQQLQQLRNDLAKYRAGEYPLSNDNNPSAEATSIMQPPLPSNTNDKGTTETDELRKQMEEQQKKVIQYETQLIEKETALQSTQEEIQRLLQQQENERLTNQTELTKYQQAANDVTVLYNDMNQAYYEKTEQVNALTTEIEALRSSSSSSSSFSSASTTDASNEDAVTNELRANIVERDNTILTLQTEIQTLQAQLQQGSVPDPATVAALEETKQNLEQWMAACTTRDEYIQQQTTVIEQLQKEVTDLRTMNETVQKEALASQTSAEQSSLAHENFTNQLNEKNGEISTLTTSLEQERQRYTELEQQYNDYVDHYNSLYQQYNELNTQYTEGTQQQTELTNQLNQVQTESTDLRTRYTELHQQYTDLQNQHTEAVNQYRSLQNHTEQQHQSTNQFYTEQLTTLQQTVQETERTNQELRASLESYQTSYAAVEQQNQELQRTVQGLTNEKEQIIQHYQQVMEHHQQQLHDTLRSINDKFTALRTEKMNLSDEHEDLLVLLAIREEETKLLEQALYQRGGYEEVTNIKNFSLKALEDMAQAAEEAGPDNDTEFSKYSIDESVNSIMKLFTNKVPVPVSSTVSTATTVQVPTVPPPVKPVVPTTIASRVTPSPMHSSPPTFSVPAPTVNLDTTSFVNSQPAESRKDAIVNSALPVPSNENTAATAGPSSTSGTSSAPWVSTITSAHPLSTNNNEVTEETESINPFGTEMNNETNPFASSSMQNPIDPTQLVDIDLDPLSPPPSSLSSYDRNENGGTGFTNVLGQMFGQVLGNNNPQANTPYTDNGHNNNGTTASYAAYDNHVSSSTTGNAFFTGSNYSTQYSNDNSVYNSSTNTDMNYADIASSSSYTSSNDYAYGNNNNNPNYNATSVYSPDEPAEQPRGLFSFVAGMAKSVINQPTVAKIANTIKLAATDSTKGEMDSSLASNYGNGTTAASMFQGSSNNHGSANEYNDFHKYDNRNGSQSDIFTQPPVITNTTTNAHAYDGNHYDNTTVNPTVSYAPWVSSTETTNTAASVESGNSNAPWSNSYSQPGSNHPGYVTDNNMSNNNYYNANPYGMNPTVPENTTENKPGTAANNGVSSIIGTLRSSGIFNSLAGAFLGSEHDEVPNTHGYPSQMQPPYDDHLPQQQQPQPLQTVYDPYSTTSNPSTSSAMFTGSTINTNGNPANDFFSSNNTNEYQQSYSNSDTSSTTTTVSTSGTPFWGSTVTNEHPSSSTTALFQGTATNTDVSTSGSSVPWSNPTPPNPYNVDNASYSDSIHPSLPPPVSSGASLTSGSSNPFMNPAALSSSTASKGGKGYPSSGPNNAAPITYLSSSTVSSSGGGIVWSGSLRSSRNTTNSSSASNNQGTGGYAAPMNVFNPAMQHTANVNPTVVPPTVTPTMFNPAAAVSAQMNTNATMYPPPPSSSQGPPMIAYTNTNPNVRRMSQTQVAFASPNTARKWFEPTR